MIEVCATCGVETAPDHPEVSPICADERQYVPASGQRWTNLATLRAEGLRVAIADLEPDLWGLRANGVGIGQTSLVVRTPAGVVLWDPVGFLDEAAVDFVRGLGTVLAVVASHPHMFGVQVEWGRALDAPVLVNARDAHWVQRPDARIQLTDGTRELAPGLLLHRLGGHFAGSQVLEWRAGAEGRGVLLSSDTINVNADRATATFMRSYPNRIPLSAEVTMRLADAVQTMPVDRAVNNFATVLPRDAKEAILRSAERQVGWMTGRFDAYC